LQLAPPSGQGGRQLIPRPEQSGRGRQRCAICTLANPCPTHSALQQRACLVLERRRLLREATDGEPGLPGARAKSLATTTEETRISLLLSEGIAADRAHAARELIRLAREEEESRHAEFVRRRNVANFEWKMARRVEEEEKAMAEGRARRQLMAKREKQHVDHMRTEGERLGHVVGARKGRETKRAEAQLLEALCNEVLGTAKDKKGTFKKYHLRPMSVAIDDSATFWKDCDLPYELSVVAGS
jgi:hypothetical protein